MIGGDGYNGFMPFTKGHPFYLGSEKGWFKKGQPSWLKGTRGIVKPNRGSFKKGQHVSRITEFQKNDPRITGVNSFHWKGDRVGYSGVHIWLNKKYGKAKECEFCGILNGEYEWANKSGEYKRDVSDWLSLCLSCHRGYDQQQYKSWNTRRRKYGETGQKQNIK